MRKLITKSFFLTLVTIFIGASTLLLSKDAQALDSCTVVTTPNPVQSQQGFSMTVKDIFNNPAVRNRPGGTVQFSFMPGYNLSGTLLGKDNTLDGFATVTQGPTSQGIDSPYSDLHGYTVTFTLKDSGNYSQNICSGTVFVSPVQGYCYYGGPEGRQVVNNCNAQNGYTPVTSTNQTTGEQSCQCQGGTTPNNGSKSDSSTPPQSGGNGFGALATCINASGTKVTGLDTPFGCIESTPASLVSTVLKIILGVAGGIAILLIMIGGFKVATSNGDPEALQEGRSMITAAIIGLAFILLATTILGIIGVDILGIKFFQKSGTGVTILTN